MRGKPAVIPLCGVAAGTLPLIRSCGHLPLGKAFADCSFAASPPISRSPSRSANRASRFFLLCLLVLHDIGADLAVQYRHDAVGTFGQLRLMRDHDEGDMVVFGQLQHPVQHLLAGAESRLPVGSSAKMTLGLLTNARAMPTRCCWPPLISVGRWLARPKRPMAFSSLRARASRVFCPRP